MRNIFCSLFRHKERCKVNVFVKNFVILNPEPSGLRMTDTFSGTRKNVRPEVLTVTGRNLKLLDIRLAFEISPLRSPSLKP
jgi:hypothetical protein